MEPVASHWRDHERLGKTIIRTLSRRGFAIYNGKNEPEELTQTCYSTIPAVVVELGNASYTPNDDDIEKLSRGLCAGIEAFVTKETL